MNESERYKVLDEIFGREKTDPIFAGLLPRKPKYGSVMTKDIVSAPTVKPHRMVLQDGVLVRR